MDGLKIKMKAEILGGSQMPVEAFTLLVSPNLDSLESLF